MKWQTAPNGGGCYRHVNNLSYCFFPKDEMRRKQWEVQIRRKNFKASQYSKICSKHFTADCFDLTKFGGTWLKHDAMPTIFSFSKPLQKSVKKRKSKKRALPPENNSEELKVALIQFAVSANKEQNVERICKFIKEAAENGAKLICLPECFNAPYGIKYFNEYAEVIPGYTSTALSKSAKDNSIYLIGGTFPERCGGKLYNTCLAYGPEGQLLAKHRKVHLFDIDIPGKITFKESAALSAGDSLTMFNLGNWKIGIGICYDIRFPLMANIYAEKGCQLLVYPGSFNMTTGPAHWELLQRARAVDNQLYVAGISPARDEQASYISWGHSLLVSPWGEVVCAADEKEKIIYSEIDLFRVDEIRAQIPISQQQRNDLYSIKYALRFSKNLYDCSKF